LGFLHDFNPWPFPFTFFPRFPPAPFRRADLQSVLPFPFPYSWVPRPLPLPGVGPTFQIPFSFFRPPGHCSLFPASPPSSVPRRTKLRPSFVFFLAYELFPSVPFFSCSLIRYPHRAPLVFFSPHQLASSSFPEACLPPFFWLFLLERSCLYVDRLTLPPRHAPSDSPSSYGPDRGFFLVVEGKRVCWSRPLSFSPPFFVGRCLPLLSLRFSAFTIPFFSSLFLAFFFFVLCLQRGFQLTL